MSFFERRLLQALAISFVLLFSATVFLHSHHSIQLSVIHKGENAC